MAPRALSATLPKITRTILARGGRDYATIIAQWPAIVGPALAGSSQPEKLARRRPPGERSGEQAEPAAGAVLTVRVTGGAALEIQHREPQIVERINGYLGFRAVTRLKLVQGVLSGRPPPPRREPRDLTPAEQQAIDSTSAQVIDPELKELLARFGRTLAGRKAPNRR